MAETAGNRRAVSILPTEKPGSKAWLEQRALRVGGSEIAAVMGLSPWESPFSLWHRKAGNVPPLNLDDSEVVHWGNVLEPVVRAEFMTRNRATHYIHPELGVTVAKGVAIASPDAIVSRRPRRTQREVLEIKTARDLDGWGDEGTDQIPVHYLCQVQWYMGVLDLPVAHIAVLARGSEFRQYRVAHNPDDFTLMMDAAERFVQSLRDGAAPPLDSSEATHDVVRALHPGIDRGDQSEIDANLAAWLISSKAELEAVKTSHREAQSRVLDAMGNSQHANHPDGHRIAYRMARGESTPFLVVDKAALKSHRGEAA